MEKPQNNEEILQNLQKLPKFIPNFQDQFEKHNLLGRGSVAAGGVYEYIKKSTQDSYAVKIYTEKLQNTSLKYIINEIQILTKIDECLKSENVIKFHGYGIDIIKNYVDIYLVLDKADGTLQDLWEERQKDKQYLDLQQIIKITQQLILTFAELEGRGLTHRDLKMENILYQVSIDGNILVKISDFSEGKLFINNEQTLNTFAGNIYHVSPEVYYSLKRGKVMDIKYSTFQNDVYGLGVMLIDLCLLNRKSNRDKESEVNPFENLEGPYDDEWNTRINDIKQIYTNKEPLEAEKINDICNFLSKMIIFSPKQRPKFNQLLYFWMDIEPVRIMPINYEYEYLDKIEEKDREISLLKAELQKLKLQKSSSDIIDNTETVKSYVYQNDSQNDNIQLENNNIDCAEFKTTIPFKQSMQEMELKKKDSDPSLSNVVFQISEQNKNALKIIIGKLTDQKDMTQINSKHEIVRKLGSYKKKVQFKAVDEKIVKAIGYLTNPQYIILNLQGHRFNCCNSVKYVCEAIQAMPQVQSLQINIGCWENTSDEEIELLCISLQKLQNIQCLQLLIWEWGYRNKQVTDKSLINIGNTLKFLKNKLIYLKLGLERWGCENNEITDFGYQKLFQDLQELNLMSFSGTFGRMSSLSKNLKQKFKQKLESLKIDLKLELN